MLNSIRFLVFWVGTKCTLKCKNCCNLIPYVNPVSYSTKKILDNLSYITKDIVVETLQIQGGEPFTHKEIDSIIEFCALNPNIHKIEIASNGTIIPNKRTIDVIKKYNEKIVLRFSDYVCDRKKRQIIEDRLKNQYNVDVQKYEFMYNTGEWFDLGDVDNKKETDIQKRKKTYDDCPNRSCWTLADDYLAGCGRMISYLQLKNETIKGNNILNISELRETNYPFIEAYQKFEERYRTFVSDLCGYCRISDKLIPAGNQIAQRERKKEC